MRLRIEDEERPTSLAFEHPTFNECSRWKLKVQGWTFDVSPTTLNFQRRTPNIQRMQ